VNAQPYPQELSRPAGRTQLILLALGAGALLGIGIAFLNPLLVLLGMLGLAFVAAIFALPELGLLGFVAVANLLPFAVIPVRLGLSLTLVDVMLTTLLMAWIYWMVARGRPFVDTALTVVILVYLGLALTSFVLGMTYSISPERFRLFIKSINSILLFFGTVNCIRDSAALKRVIRALLFGGVAAAAIAIVLLYLPETTAAQLLSSLGVLGYPTGANVLRPIADTDILRAIGTSVDPNVLGGLLMMASAMLAAQLFSAAPILSRRLLWPMVVVAVAGLLMTHSRSALGGLVIGAAVVGLFKDRRLLLLMLAIAVAMPFVPQAEVLLERLASGVSFQDRGAAMRLDEYRDAINLIAMYPWFGIGFGEPPSIDLYLGVSSLYLLIGQEMGLIGLSAFLAVLGILGWQIASGLRLRHEDEVGGMLLSLAAALGAALSAGLLDHYYANILFPHMVALFWLYVGLATVAVRLNEPGV
jgi:polysaccharide biosynthesis protein PslJ